MNKIETLSVTCGEYNDALIIDFGLLEEIAEWAVPKYQRPRLLEFLENNCSLTDPNYFLNFYESFISYFFSNISEEFGEFCGEVILGDPKDINSLCNSMNRNNENFTIEYLDIILYLNSFRRFCSEAELLFSYAEPKDFPDNSIIGLVKVDFPYLASSNYLLSTVSFNSVLKEIPRCFPCRKIHKASNFGRTELLFALQKTKVIIDRAMVMLFSEIGITYNTTLLRDNSVPAEVSQFSLKRVSIPFRGRFPRHCLSTFNRFNHLVHKKWHSISEEFDDLQTK